VDLQYLYEEGLLTIDELNSAKQENPYVCEFERLNKERMALLSKAASRMKNNDAIDSFMASHPETEKFCEYMALRAANNNLPWNEWTVTEPDPELYKAWRFAEYAFFSQWAQIKKYANSKNISIIGDIPIYVSWDSADVWSSPESFQLDERCNPKRVAGVPPDYFSEDGQLWGNPLYDWKKMKEDNYSWWRRRMSFMFELFDGVRIDHFRGLQSYYSIPASATTAKNGKWVKGPGMSLIKALQPICQDKLIIAEDLGDITPEVEKLVKDSGYPGMRVLQFGFVDEEETAHIPHNYIQNCVAYTGTHDNNTLLGFVWELDEPARRRMFDYFGYPYDNINDGCECMIRSLLASNADIVILPIQDILKYGADTRMNTPGVAEGNWAYRVKREQLSEIDRGKYKYWNSLYFRDNK
jgi:4-alpha-glucanotransferase